MTDAPSVAEAVVYRSRWFWRATWKGELLPNYFRAEADAWRWMERLESAKP